MRLNLYNTTTSLHSLQVLSMCVDMRWLWQIDTHQISMLSSLTYDYNGAYLVLYGIRDWFCTTSNASSLLAPMCWQIYTNQISMLSSLLYDHCVTSYIKYTNCWPSNCCFIRTVIAQQLVAAEAYVCVYMTNHRWRYLNHSI